MAVHVVRDTGGDWRTALANSFLAPLLTGLVNNHFEGLRTAKENALLGELANAAGNMPNTAPEQGNGFAGQFTPPGMMQSGQGGGLNQLFNILGNPRFKSVSAARAMELAKPWLTEQFYNGFNPADTAQMMRGMGMGYVPKEAASYYSDMYKYQNPHQQFQNMNLGDRVVYGGFNPANGQFTQGGEMAVGMNPYQAGSLANDRQRIANDYALGIRRDDTSRYGMDLQNQQFGATMDYNREGREADNAFRDRQQTWYENPENPRNRTEKKILTDAEGKIVRIDPFAEAGDTGFKAAPQTAQTNGGDVTKIYHERANLARKEAAKIDAEDGELANLKMRVEGLEPNSAEAAEALKQIQAMEAKQRRLIDEANIYDQLYANPNAENYFDSTGQVKPIPQQYRIQANPQAYANAQPMSSAPQGAAQPQSGDNADNDYYSKMSPKLQGILQKYGRKGTVYERRDNKIAIKRGEFDKIVSEAVKNGDISGVEELVNELKSAGIYITKETAQQQGTGTADAMNAIGGKTAPNAEAQPQRTDTAAAMKAIGGNTPQTQSGGNAAADEMFNEVKTLPIPEIQSRIATIRGQMKRNPDWPRTQPIIGIALKALEDELNRRPMNGGR